KATSSSLTSRPRDYTWIRRFRLLGNQRCANPRKAHRSGCQRTPQSAFQFKQLAFHVEAATIAAECPVRGDYTMAGHHDRNRVPVVGYTHRAEGFGLANGAGDVSVGAGLAVGNVEQRIPALQLKSSSAQIEWEAEAAASAVEIFAQFSEVGLRPAVG